jgi:2-hydroxychromene-2-carboxylate isomerase
MRCPMHGIAVMAGALTFWFEFASTYSYPAAMRAGALAAEAGVTLRFQPFLLGPIFRSQGWETSPFNLIPAKGRYMWRDLDRTCAALDLPLRRPDPFPQPSLLAARVALVALARGFGEDFIRAVFTAEFARGRQIGDEAVIAETLEQLGAAPEPILAEACSEPVKAGLREATGKAQALGIFGAPSFVTADGELFWGNDRLEAAISWAAQARS